MYTIRSVQGHPSLSQQILSRLFYARSIPSAGEGAHTYVVQGLLEYHYSSKGSSQASHIALHSIVVSTRNRMFVFFDTDSMHIVSLVCVYTERYHHVL